MLRRMTTTATAAAPPPYDVARMRAHFPQLDGRTGDAAHFDGPGGTQTPDVVARAISDTLLAPLANRGSMTAAERNAEATVAGCRTALADLLGAAPRGIVVGRSMTDLTFDLARTLAADWSPGDEVVVTSLDHDANIRPWVIAAQRAGATVRWAEFDPRTAELTPDDVSRVLSERTKVVAFTGASNLLGTRPPVRAIADLAHAVGALVAVDGVHLSAHAPIDVVALGADSYACSPYKFLGPHCGVLAIRPELLATLRPDKLRPSTEEIPERFELGTLPYELMAGTTAAIDLLADAVPADPTAAAPTDGSRRERLLTSMRAIEAHEDRLRRRIETGLRELGATVWSRAAHRTPTLLVSWAGVESAQVSRALADRWINAPAGSFYAIEAAERLGLGAAGALRIGLAPYTDDADVDRLLTALAEIVGG